MIKLTQTSQKKFKLGQLVATPAALEAIKNANQSLMDFIRPHIAGEWGNLCDEDKKLNDKAIANEHTAGTENDLRGRVLSAYQTRKGVKIWIITEADRSITTILLPEDY